MSSPSIAKSQNPKSVTPKKGSAKSNTSSRRLTSFRSGPMAVGKLDFLI